MLDPPKNRRVFHFLQKTKKIDKAKKVWSILRLYFYLVKEK